MQVSERYIVLERHVPQSLSNPTHSSTPLHPVLRTGGGEPSGSFSDPSDSCPCKSDDRICIWGPFQGSVLGITRRGGHASHSACWHVDASARYSPPPGHVSVLRNYVAS